MASIAFTPTPTPSLTPIQEQVIAFIAAGISIREVADEAGVHRNTIGNWRRTNPAFAQALANAQYDRVLYWRDAAEEHAALAIQTIAEILQDRKAPAGVRLRAALAMLEHATTLPPAAPAEPIPPPSDTPVTRDQVTAPTPKPIHVVHVEQPQKVHNPAQRPSPKTRPKSPQKKAPKAA